MPSVQVKDFPQGLYDQLKQYAEANHRSMAQQLIVAAEQMLAGGASNERIAHAPFAGTEPAGARHGLVARDFNEQARAERIARRRAIFAQIDKANARLKEQGSSFFDASSEEAIEFIRQDRERF